jgi:hypothetical protein
MAAEHRGCYAHCGEGGVVNPGERWPRDERAENVGAVDHAGAHDRGERGELGQERHAWASEPPPNGGNAPIC